MVDPSSVVSLKVALADASGWSEWCTIAVAAAVSVEFLALFIFSKEMPKSEKGMMGVATLVIALGCAGEYVFGARASFAAAQLQTASDFNVAKAQSDAAIATQAAADSNLRAAQIERSAAWRNMPDTMQSTLATKLSVMAGGSIEISWPAYDTEALSFSIQFENIFVKANTLANKKIWTISEQPRLFATDIFFGVRAHGSDEKKVESVRQALDDVGFPARAGTPIPNMLVSGPGTQIGGIALTDVQIWVGTKPR